MNLFRLKEFTIKQEQSALKIGTDGMLLGAWVADKFRSASHLRILDVGTGTGIIALMLAQELPMSEITGIEIDALSAEEAQHNAAHSPFANRVKIIQGDFRKHTFEQPFDLVVSNPPYYTSTHSSRDQRATIAKHSVELSPLEFFGACNASTVVIIVAQSATASYIEAAQEFGFHLAEQIDIITKQGKTPQRQILQFSKSNTSTPLQLPLPQSHLSITILQGQGRHDYTKEYSRLLRPYLTIL